ncbi:MAG: hypothetical protein E6I44_13195 [Chloroflexi bacterium]|nr:MAG: hypothetical protein E6I44_13195 [Chloroflexota bacterium]
MFGLNLVPPLVRTAMMMLLLGGLVGYVGTAFTTTLVADSGILGNSGESNAAHKYMLALLQRESDNLSRLGPSADVVSRALQQQNVSQQPQDVKPLTVTYLGGASSGRISVQIYAVEVQASGGQYQFLPFSLTLIGGRVQRVE